MKIKMAGKTDIGRKRKNNQDSIYYNEKSGIGLVADGIGGRKGGEIASSMIVNGLKNEYLKGSKILPDEIIPFIINSIDICNSEIINKGLKNRNIAGMGTTLNGLFFVGTKLYIAHVGDSRTYMIHKSNIFQLTFDHSVKNFLDKGWIAKESISPNAKKDSLVRAVGIVENCESDVYDVNLEEGQIFITCSDGLSGMISDRKILKIVLENKENFNELPKLLIDAANNAGGGDNITVLACQVKKE